MPLQGDELEDFIQAYENAFNERLTAAQANELYLRLLNLYASVKRVTEETPTELPYATSPLPPPHEPPTPPAADIQM